MRWEPILAIAALLIGASWLIYVRGNPVGDLPVRDGAVTQQVTVGTVKGVLEAYPLQPEVFEYRLLMPGTEPTVLDEAEIGRLFGSEALALARRDTDNFFFRLLNISTYASLAWVLVGFTGQLAFTMRMAVQWVVSEKRGQSVVPEAFWWMSLIGGIMLFSYFVFREDIVAVIGQSTGVVIYARNLRLIYKQKKRERRAAAAVAAATEPA